jgi:hypothetical protein
MASYARKSLVTLFAGAAIVTGIAAPASAATQKADGLVNVQVGDITIEDVNVGVAAGIAATACDLVDVGSVEVLASNTDTTSRSSTVCVTDGGKVKFTQN